MSKGNAELGWLQDGPAGS